MIQTLDKQCLLFNKLKIVLLLTCFGLGLLACGDSDTGSPDKSQSMTNGPMTNMPVEAYDPDVPSMVVEDNGVIQEEEIYKHWPEQQAAGNESKVTMAEAKTHTVFGQATSFNPKILFINPGDTVQWVNMTIHDSVSMQGLIPEGAEPWKFNIGQNGAVTLPEEGVYIYKCNPHYPNGMVAAIIVGKPINIEQVQTNATGRSKGIVIKVVKALATR
ncbi:MAG: hypothetical protein IIA06_00130 [Proteobacteria bacterium]|nr:hypothetical protein [Pseudomonadota bacterium]